MFDTSFERSHTPNTKAQSTTEDLPPEDMTDDELKAGIEFHERQAMRLKHEGAKLWRLRLRIGNGEPIDRKMLAELHERRASRISPANAAPVVGEDPHPGFDCGGTCVIHGGRFTLEQKPLPPKNATFEVWWKGQIARDFVHAALTELEKVSGPKLVAGQGSFAIEATAISAARRSLDSALSILDSADSIAATAATAAPQVDDCDAARVQRLEAQMQGLLNSLATSQQEVERLRAGNFTPQEFQNLCHNLDESDREVFVAGCLEYQRKLFGDSATAAPVEQSAIDLDPLEFWCDLVEVLGHPRPVKVNPVSVIAEAEERLRQIPPTKEHTDVTDDETDRR